MPHIDVMETGGMAPQLLEAILAAPIPDLNDLPRCRQTHESLEQLIARFSGLDPHLEAGLWLLAGDLDRSHSISQALGSPEGSIWHAIMHRREGDFWNSKYWYRKAGTHSVKKRLADQILQATSPSAENPIRISLSERWTNPATVCEALVDQVEQSVGDQDDWQSTLQRVCWWEWQLLFEHCWRLASKTH